MEIARLSVFLLLIFLQKTVTANSGVHHSCSAQFDGKCRQCDCVPDCFDLSDEKNCSKGSIESQLYEHIGDIKMMDTCMGFEVKVPKFFPPPPLPPFSLCNPPPELTTSTVPSTTVATTPTSTVPSTTVATTPTSTVPSTTVATTPTSTVPSTTVATTPTSTVPSTTVATTPITSYRNPSDTYESTSLFSPSPRSLPSSTTSASNAALSTFSNAVPSPTASTSASKPFRSTSQAAITFSKEIRPLTTTVTYPATTQKGINCMQLFPYISNYCRRQYFFIEDVRSCVTVLCFYYKCDLPRNYPTRLPQTTTSTTTRMTPQMSSGYDYYENRDFSIHQQDSAYSYWFPLLVEN